MTEAEILDKLGTQTEIAKILGISRQRVFQMRQEGIPWMSRYSIFFVALMKHQFPKKDFDNQIPTYLWKLGLPEDFLDRKAYDRKQKRRRGRRNEAKV